MQEIENMSIMKRHLTSQGYQYSIKTGLCEIFCWGDKFEVDSNLNSSSRQDFHGYFRFLMFWKPYPWYRKSGTYLCKIFRANHYNGKPCWVDKFDVDSTLKSIYATKFFKCSWLSPFSEVLEAISMILWIRNRPLQNFSSISLQWERVAQMQKSNIDV